MDAATRYRRRERDAHVRFYVKQRNDILEPGGDERHASLPTRVRREGAHLGPRVCAESKEVPSLKKERCGEFGARIVE